MISIESSSAFDRKAKKFFKKRPELKDTFKEFLNTFVQNPFNQRPSTHQIYKKK